MHTTHRPRRCRRSGSTCWWSGWSPPRRRPGGSSCPAASRYEERGWMDGGWTGPSFETHTERTHAPLTTLAVILISLDRQDPLHVVRVVSFGEGQVGESGVLAPLKVGLQGKKRTIAETIFDVWAINTRTIHHRSTDRHKPHDRAWRWATWRTPSSRGASAPATTSGRDASSPSSARTTCWRGSRLRD